MPGTAKKILLAVVSVAVALLVVELGLRLTNYGRITPGMNFGVNTRQALDQGRFLPDDDLFWKLPPHPRDGEIRAVQPDRPLPPTTAGRRVLVLGDSCSRLSMGTPPYSALLDAQLGRGVEVWNAAVPGYTVWQGRAWWRRQLARGGFDAVVVYFGWNDHWRATGTTDRAYAESLDRGGPRLLSLFGGRADEAPLRMPLEDYRATLRSLVGEIQATGARVILVAAPANLTGEARQRLVQTGYLTAADDAVALHRRYLGALAEVAAETGADVLNALGVYAGAGADPARLIMRDGIHLTDDGHRVMAAILAPVLAAEGDAAMPTTENLVTLARSVLAPAGGAP